MMRPTKQLILALAMCVALNAHSQVVQDPMTKPVDAATKEKQGSLEIDEKPSVPSSRPPVTAAAAKAPATAPAPALSLKPSTPAPATTVQDEAVLRNMVEATRNSLATQIKPPPAELTLKPGVTEVIPISIGRMNRLITPFSDPIVQTISNAEIKRQGKVLNVATDQPAAVSLFVMDRNDPDHALSITLMPASIPPVHVTVHMEGYTPKPVSRDTEKTTSNPAATAYVDAIKALLRGVALGKVPDGYSMRRLTAME